MDTKTRIGWIGTGVMGLPMAGHLLAAAYPLTVYSRTKFKAQDLLARGAIWADSPAAVARAAEVIFTMVGFPDDVRQAYLGSTGVLAAARAGQTLIDMTSTEPSLAGEIFEKATAKGAAFLDAPVSGGDVGAREARLSIMVGGERAAFEKAKPFFEILGKNIVYQGASGAGQHAKLANQIVIAGTMIGVCEALLYAKRAGLDPEAWIAAISKGAAGCWTIENLVPRILKRNFAPGFMIDHFVKDMGIALDEAQRLNLKLPGLFLVKTLYETIQAKGHGCSGTHALMLAVEAMNEVS